MNREQQHILMLLTGALISETAITELIANEQDGQKMKYYRHMKKRYINESMKYTNKLIDALQSDFNIKDADNANLHITKAYELLLYFNGLGSNERTEKVVAYAKNELLELLNSNPHGSDKSR